MTAKKEPAPIPEKWIECTPQEVEVGGRVSTDIEYAGDGRMAFKVQNGGGPILFGAPETQFWRWADSVVMLILRRKSERQAELIHTLVLEVANLQTEIHELEEDATRNGRILELANEKLRRIKSFFAKRDDITDSAMQNIDQSIHASIYRDRPEIFEDCGPVRNLW